MNCSQCDNPLPEGVTTCQRCASAPLPVPKLPTTIHGRVKVRKQSGGMAAGVNAPHNQNIGPTTIHQYGTAQTAPAPDATGEKRWFHVPSANRVFTGREQELQRLHDALQSGNAALTPLPHALQGMGGVGKSQTALAYVHRHGHAYTYVFWVRGETPGELGAQLAGLAAPLALPVAPQADTPTLLQAVLAWFGIHAGWLLVIDNAEHLLDLKPILPQHPAGRILLTTREDVPASFAERIPLAHLDEPTGALLLLRRAGLLRPDQTLDAATAQQQVDACAISREVDGLPLALDQAGAYIENRPLTLAAYLRAYRERRETMHRAYQNPDHASVSVTFDLALEQVRQTTEWGEAAAKLARVCAFLAPDSIPYAIFTQGAAVLSETLAGVASDEFAFAEVCRVACQYALLRRDTDPPGLWMHRLAQEVLRDCLADDVQQKVRKQVVQSVSAAYPAPDYPVWPLCERLLPMPCCATNTSSPVTYAHSKPPACSTTPPGICKSAPFTKRLSRCMWRHWQLTEPCRAHSTPMLPLSLIIWPCCIGAWDATTRQFLGSRRCW